MTMTLDEVYPPVDETAFSEHTIHLIHKYVYIYIYLKTMGLFVLLTTLESPTGFFFFFFLSTNSVRVEKNNAFSL